LLIASPIASLIAVYSKLTARQKATVKGAVAISFVVYAYALTIVVGSSLLLAEACPLFNRRLIYVTLAQTVVGETGRGAKDAWSELNRQQKQHFAIPA